MMLFELIYICIKIFKKELFFYIFVLSFGVLCISALLTSTEIYKYEMRKDLESKQPHFTIYKSKSKQINNNFDFFSDLKKVEGVTAVSPFFTSYQWIKFKANTDFLYNENSFDRINSGYFTIIGVDKKSPSIISWEEIKFYTAGTYKTRMTNLQFEYEWIKNPNLVVPNAVFDSGFFPPISQEASIKSELSKDIWKVKGFIQDRMDEARLYKPFYFPYIKNGLNQKKI